MAAGIDYAPELTLPQIHNRILNAEAEIAALKEHIKPHLDRLAEVAAAEKAEADAKAAAEGQPAGPSRAVDYDPAFATAAPPNPDPALDLTKKGR